MSHSNRMSIKTKYLALGEPRRKVLGKSLVLMGVLATFFNTGCSDTSRVVAISEPDPELVFVRGYRSVSDTCMLTGESSFTVDFLDDAADLVTCPTGDPAASTLVAEVKASIVTQTNSFTLYSVPRR